jgi:RNA polymerase sigma-70 factor (ECF subfamily)
MEWYGINLQWAYSELLSRIYRHCICKQGALDILHDALVRFALAKNPDRFQQPHAFLQAIVNNQLVDEFRYHRRLEPLESADALHDFDEHVLGTEFYTPSAEHLADIKQRLHAMQLLIDSLPTRCREVFWLYRVEGMKQSQIAQALNISLKMVERHVARGYVALIEANELMR